MTRRSRIKTLIVIIGPTASGKTSMAVSVAKELGTEVISADSRQFFKHLNIGTAKPTADEMDGVRHHFVDVLELDEHMSAGHYADQVLQLLDDLFKEHEQVVLTGGSGLYVDAVCYGLDELPTANPAIRAELNAIFEEKGLDPILEELERDDPEAFANVEKQNPHRVIRAIEVLRQTGRPIGDFQKGKKQKRPFRIKIYGIEQDRDVLYDRINTRVDQMVDAGLLDEVKRLLPFRHLNALNTVGYKELFDHLDGNTSLVESVASIKRNTRRYAKRQMTWWRKNDEIKWVGPSDHGSIIAQERE